MATDESTFHLLDGDFHCYRQTDLCAPVVLLLGWTESLPKHVNKYAQVWRERTGASTLALTAPSRDIFSLKSLTGAGGGMRALAARVVAAVEEEVIPNPQHFFLLFHFPGARTVYIHTFSNGGTVLYLALRQILKEDPSSVLAKGLNGAILDSAPGWLWPSAGAKASTEHLKGPVRWLVRGIIYVTMGVGSVLFRLKNGISLPESFFSAMAAIDTGVPELFIYGADDPLCDSHKLEEHLAVRRARGADVSTRTWTKSRHVSHYVVHRDEYLAALDSFVAKCSG